jgi:hypothetical protein
MIHIAVIDKLVKEFHKGTTGKRSHKVHTPHQSLIRIFVQIPS